MHHGGFDGTQVGANSNHSLTRYSVQFLRDLEIFFGSRFKIAPVPFDLELVGSEKETGQHVGSGEVAVSCVGIGYSNVNKAMA